MNEAPIVYEYGLFEFRRVEVLFEVNFEIFVRVQGDFGEMSGECQTS